MYGPLTIDDSLTNAIHACIIQSAPLRLIFIYHVIYIYRKSWKVTSFVADCCFSNWSCKCMFSCCPRHGSIMISVQEEHFFLPFFRKIFKDRTLTVAKKKKKVKTKSPAEPVPSLFDPTLAGLTLVNSRCGTAVWLSCEQPEVTVWTETVGQQNRDRTVKSVTVYVPQWLSIRGTNSRSLAICDGF